MTKAEIADRMADRIGFTRTDTRIMIDIFLDEIRKSVAGGHHIQLRGFGTFRPKDRKAKVVRNVRSGETMHLPAWREPIFKAHPKFKKMLR